jgi:hypothetical protein
MQIMATGVHHPLTFGGIGQARAFFHREAIHINAQTNGGSASGSEFCKNPCATHALPHPPAQTPQFAGHQRGRLMFFSTEFRMGMQVPKQFQ